MATHWTKVLQALRASECIDKKKKKKRDHSTPTFVVFATYVPTLVIDVASIVIIIFKLPNSVPQGFRIVAFQY